MDNVQQRGSSVCITGMHRSGTSLMTRWLNSCGIKFDHGNSHGPGIGNPYGHYEDRDIETLHSRLIKQYVPESKGWIVTDPKWQCPEQEFITCAREIIASKRSIESSWGWKDPRTVLMMENWLEVLPDLKVILLWRECKDVVGSLLSRSKKLKNNGTRKQIKNMDIDILTAIQTWAAYNHKVISFRESHPQTSILLHAETLRKQDQKLIELVKEKFGIELTYTPISSFWDQSLFKHRIPGLIEMYLETRLQVGKMERKLRDLSDLS